MYSHPPAPFPGKGCVEESDSEEEALAWAPGGHLPAGKWVWGPPDSEPGTTSGCPVIQRPICQEARTRPAAQPSLLTSADHKAAASAPAPGDARQLAAPSGHPQGPGTRGDPPAGRAASSRLLPVVLALRRQGCSSVCLSPARPLLQLPKLCASSWSFRPRGGSFTLPDSGSGLECTLLPAPGARAGAFVPVTWARPSPYRGHAQEGGLRTRHCGEPHASLGTRLQQLAAWKLSEADDQKFEAPDSTRHQLPPGEELQGK